MGLNCLPRQLSEKVSASLLEKALMVNDFSLIYFTNPFYFQHKLPHNQRVSHTETYTMNSKFPNNFLKIGAIFGAVFIAVVALLWLGEY